MAEERGLGGMQPLEAGIKAAAIALNAIPVVGGVLSDLAHELVASRQSKRLQDWLIETAAQLRLLPDKISQDFVRTAQFAELFEDVIEKVEATRQEEKLQALRAIFLNTVTSDRPNYDEALEILALVTSWQPRHLIMLKILDDPTAADAALGNPVGRGGGIATSIMQILRALLPGWDADQIERTWTDLYDAKIHRTNGTRVMITDTGISQLENRLSDYGTKVARYIRTPLS